MLNNKNKDILTRELIKKESKNLCINSIKINISRLLLLLPSIVILYLELITDASYITIVSIIIIMFAFLLYLLREIIYAATLLVKIRRNDFAVINDKLINKSCAKMGAYSRDRSKFYSAAVDSGIFTHYKHKLYFQNTALMYCIPRGINYEWCNCRMNQFQIYESCRYGDVFYLVLVNNKIILAYNANFFDMDE